jgi:DNA end-binding protein Ku
MGEQRKVAISRFVLRNKESLAAVRSDGKVLTLATMRFADEVVPVDQLEGVLGDSADVKPKKREVDMAKALIDSLANDFDPASYKDEHREELLGLIERKAAGEKIVSADAEEPKPTKAPDLMAALEESLAAIKGEDLAGGAKRKSGTKSKSPAKKTTAKSGSKSKSTSKAKSKSKAKAAK